MIELEEGSILIEDASEHEIAHLLRVYNSYYELGVKGDDDCVSSFNMDVIDAINDRLPDDLILGYHPDYPGTLIVQTEAWWTE